MRRTLDFVCPGPRADINGSSRHSLNHACAHTTPVKCHIRPLFESAEGAEFLMRGLSTRRFFAFGLAAAGAVPLASRLRFSSANAIETPARAVPIAPVVPKTFRAFGGARIDNYDWLRDRKDPRVIAYLNAENVYADARLESIKPLVDELAAELKAREAQEDASVPTAYNDYVYERRFTQGAQYPYIVRRKDAFGAQEEIVLDVGALAAGHAQQYQLGSWNVSPDNTRVAFAVDFTGGRDFRIFVRTIATGETVDQGIDNASSDLVFAGDSNTIFYVRNEPTTLRSYQVWRHRLGSNPKSDVLIYEESDPTFSVSIGLSRSRKFILVNIDEERTSEFRYLPADQSTEELKVIEPRRRGIIYDVDHVGGEFFIRTNLDAPDFRLMQRTAGDARGAALEGNRSRGARASSQPFQSVRDIRGRGHGRRKWDNDPCIHPPGTPRNSGAASSRNRRRLELLRGRERSQSRSGSKGPALSF